MHLLCGNVLRRQRGQRALLHGRRAGCRGFRREGLGGGRLRQANTKNGATGLSIGGVIGFTDAKASEFNVVKNCVNNGELDVQATRTGGVVATLNKYTKVEDCVNNAKISCSDVTASNSRLGGIASAAGAEVYLTRCINKGDVVFPVAGDKVHGYVAGIIGQINNAAVTVDACENYGTILSDMWYDATEKTEGDNTYRDTFMGTSWNCSA